MIGAKRRWAATTGRNYDIILDDYGRGDWSIACNVDKIGSRYDRLDSSGRRQLVFRLALSSSIPGSVSHVGVMR
jgi:hypothetical protein